MQSDAGQGPRRAPGTDEIVPVVDALQWQCAHVRERGSPVAALVLQAVIEDIAAGGSLASEFPTEVRFGDLPGLRTMATVHRLALEREAPQVALHLPTLGGRAPAGTAESERFKAAVVASLSEHQAVLADALAHAPQTNETGRAPLLRCALSTLDPSLPVRLREIGASAGVNLRADRLPGDPLLESGPLPLVVDRLGCDLHPIDPTTTEGRLALSSFIWVDDVDRFELLRRALQVAQDVPASVVQQDAAEFVEAMDLGEDTTTVLWHSAFWLYLPPDVAARISVAIDALAACATPTSRFAHASWEWSEDASDDIASYGLALRTWAGVEDDGVRRVLARGHSHGADARLVG